jgi:hypothetical protein
MPKPSAKPWHDWRNDARELAIVIIGVLIALLAQQVMQSWEWNDKVAAAKAAIRFELLVDDGPQMYQRAAMHPCLVARLDGIRSAIEAGRDLGEIHRLVDGYWVDVRTFDTLALQAAHTSDVPSHMSQDDLGRFTYPYDRMSLLDRTNMDEAAEMARLHAFRSTGSPLSNEEKNQLLGAVEALRNDDSLISASVAMMLPSIQQLGRLDPTRVHSFIAAARAHYGDCVKPPAADAAPR